MLCLPWQGLVADPLYPEAGTPTHWFVSLDRNQDGYLDAQELRLQPEWAQAVAAADHDRDARIDHTEFLSLLDRMQARR
jgi:Ca2+-binding EF-hand superfamily protein